MKPRVGLPGVSLNIAAALSDSHRHADPGLLYSARFSPIFRAMRRIFRTLALAATLAALAGPLQAACFADYKAKMDDPLRLHYGVIEIPDEACTVATAFGVIAPRVAAGGWELLEVMSVFDESGLEARRTDAGPYYLRF